MDATGARTGAALSRRRRTVRSVGLLVTLLTLVALSCACASASPAGTAALTIRTTPTPRLKVRRYVTSGVFPLVAGEQGLAPVNHALRRVVLADERHYLPAARRAVARQPHFHGIYRTRIASHLVSASTVVVSTLIPLTRLYPGGNDGQSWLAATIEVSSGRAVGLGELFRRPAVALRIVASHWKAQMRRTPLWACVAKDLPSYTPTLAHYRYFALVPNGLAFGFPQEPACSRLVATVPYRTVEPYLSPLGQRLVEGVRRPA